MSPVVHPSDLESDVVLRDGTTLRLRPVRPADAQEVLGLLERMSPQSLYYRFMEVPRVDLKRASTLATVDDERQVVLAAESGGRIAALAGYYRSDEHPERAEVAFAVADALQGRGVGTRLLERLAEIGRDRGVRVFDAYVLGDNRRMMDVFVESGFEVAQKLNRGEFHVSLSLDATPAYAE